MPNLSSYFVSNFKPQFSDFSYNKCNSSNSKICKLAILSKYIHLSKLNKKVSLHCNSSCNSTNIIYFIYCIKCSLIYIGESSRSVSLRIKEHISRINFLKKNKYNNNINEKLKQSKDCVYLYDHFRKEDHNIDNNFRFQVFTVDMISYITRMETDMMYIFNTLHPYGFNTSSIKYTPYLASYNPP